MCPLLFCSCSSHWELRCVLLSTERELKTSWTTNPKLVLPFIAHPSSSKGDTGMSSIVYHTSCCSGKLNCPWPFSLLFFQSLPGISWLLVECSSTCLKKQWDVLFNCRGLVATTKLVRREEKEVKLRRRKRRKNRAAEGWCQKEQCICAFLLCGWGPEDEVRRGMHCNGEVDSQQQ